MIRKKCSSDSDSSFNPWPKTFSKKREESRNDSESRYYDKPKRPKNSRENEKANSISNRDVT